VTVVTGARPAARRNRCCVLTRSRGSVLRKSLVLIFLAALALAARAQDEERAPFITTPEEVVERMLGIAGTGPGDFVIDLGSGDGRIVIAAAKRFGARGLGVDLDARLVRLARENAERAGVAQRVSFEVGNVLSTDVANASVVTLYLLPGLHEKLKDKLLSEMRPGARIVSHAFPFVSWKPDRVEQVRVSRPHPGQGDESRVFLWIVPGEARGAWRAFAPEAGGEWRVRIHQNFQDIEIEAAAGGRALAVREARLTGERIEWLGTFDGAPFRYAGRLTGEHIRGEFSLGEGAGARQLPLVLERLR
jgi:protein-L-isoaspartate O-methyltransferase